MGTYLFYNNKDVFKDTLPFDHVISARFTTATILDLIDHIQLITKTKSGFTDLKFLLVNILT